MSGSIGSIQPGAVQAASIKSTVATKNTNANEEANESASAKKAEGDTVSISKEAREAAG